MFLDLYLAGMLLGLKGSVLKTMLSEGWITASLRNHLATAPLMLSIQILYTQYHLKCTTPGCLPASFPRRY